MESAWHPLGRGCYAFHSLPPSKLGLFPNRKGIRQSILTSATTSTYMNQPIPIPDGHKHNFEEIVKAAKAGDLAIVSTREKGTGKPVTLLCCFSDKGNGQWQPIPFAKMFNGDPYEQFEDPELDINEPYGLGLHNNCDHCNNINDNNISITE